MVPGVPSCTPDWYIDKNLRCFTHSHFPAILSPPTQYRGKGGMSSSVMAGCATGGVLGLRGERYRGGGGVICESMLL